MIQQLPLHTKPSNKQSQSLYYKLTKNDIRQLQQFVIPSIKYIVSNNAIQKRLSDCVTNFGQSQNNILFIQGEVLSGKSICLKYIFNNMLKNQEWITRFYKWTTPYQNQEIIQQIKYWLESMNNLTQNKRIMIILDNYDQQVKVFEKLISENKKIKVICTCKPSSNFEIYNDFKNFERVKLLLFSYEQVQKYIKHNKHTNNKWTTLLEGIISSNIYLEEYIVHPAILKLIIQIYSNIQYSDMINFTIFDLCGKYFELWFSERVNNGINSEILDQFLKFCSYSAIKKIDQNINSYLQLQKISFLMNNNINYEFRNPIKQTKENNYEFIHPIFQHYLIANYIIDEIISKDGEKSQNYYVQLMITLRNNIQYIKIKLISDEKLQTYLFDIATKNKSSHHRSELIFLILNSIGFSYSGRDLSGICLAHVNMDYGMFHKTNLTNADLNMTSFKYAFLQQCVMAGDSYNYLQSKPITIQQSGKKVYFIAATDQNIVILNKNGLLNKSIVSGEQILIPSKIQLQSYYKSCLSTDLQNVALAFEIQEYPLCFIHIIKMISLSRKYEQWERQVEFEIQNIIFGRESVIYHGKHKTEECDIDTGNLLHIIQYQIDSEDDDSHAMTNIVLLNNKTMIIITSTSLFIYNQQRILNKTINFGFLIAYCSINNNLQTCSICLTQTYSEQYEKRLVYYDFEEQSRIQKWVLPSINISNVSLSHDSRFALLQYYNKYEIWCLQTKNKLFDILDLNRIELLPKSNKLVISNSNTIKICNVLEEQPPKYQISLYYKYRFLKVLQNNIMVELNNKIITYDLSTGRTISQKSLQYYVISAINYYEFYIMQLNGLNKKGINNVSKYNIKSNKEQILFSIDQKIILIPEVNFFLSSNLEYYFILHNWTYLALIQTKTKKKVTYQKIGLIKSVIFTEDNQILILGSAQKIQFIRVKTGIIFRKIQINSQIIKFQFSTNNEYLMAATKYQVLLIKLSNYQIVLQEKLNGYIVYVGLIRDKRELILFTDQEMILKNLETKSERKFKNYYGEIKNIIVLENSDRMVLISDRITMIRLQEQQVLIDWMQPNYEMIQLFM